MKISVNWLQSLAGGVKIMPKSGIDELVKKIGAQLGAVEEVIDLGKKYQGIVIAKVVECEKHPNADKLHVCKIDDDGIVKGVKRDAKGLVQVVCGAPNVHADMLVVWLPPGATVPSSVDKEPLVLEAREIRGVVSNGMLASASELAISADHTGIIEIENPGDVTHKDPSVDMNDHIAAMKNIEIVRKHKPGDDFAKAFELNDYIIDIENKMFTHRPDLFGQLGVAREVAGIQQIPFYSPKWYLTPKSTTHHPQSKELKLKAKNEIPELVPRFLVQVFEGVEIGPSPVWMQTYLSRVGIRPINNIVDITNYFMMETGQPLHAYDYDKLAGSLEVRKSKKGDKLRLLNGKEVTFDDNSTILITSANKPVGIGGVMGGADTEVDPHTKNIVLECANFDMFNIRRTSMKYGLFTDAVTRFNKGQSPLQNDRVLAWARDEIIHQTGALPGAIFDIKGNIKPLTMIRVSTKFINERLGLELTPDEMQTLLINVEFKVERSDNKDELKVTPPFWRTDVEIREDIVEEIGRLYGYDHLPLVLPGRDLTPAQQNELLELKQVVRMILARAGANEVLTYSFVHGDLLDKVGQDRKQAFQLNNAISPDLQYYRLSLTPSLLDKVHANIKAGYDEFTIFEINKAHNKQAENIDGVPKEFENLALVIAASDKTKQTGAPYYQARKYLDELTSKLGIELRYEPIDKARPYPAAQPYDHTRSALVYAKDGNKIIGMVGEFKLSVSKALKLPAFAAGFEIGLSQEVFGKSANRYKRLSKYPSVQQDISLRVPAHVQFGELFGFVEQNIDYPENTRYELFPVDIYQRVNDSKHKQITFRLIISSFAKTMTDPEVNSMLDAVAAKAKTEFGAERV